MKEGNQDIRWKQRFQNFGKALMLLRGESRSFEQASRISCLLNEETSMPHRFDVLQYETIKCPELLEHIDRVGVVVFQRHERE